MRCHHFVLEAFPELLHAVLHTPTLERVQILDDGIILRGPLEFQTRLLLCRFALVGICIKQIKDSLVVQLDVGARNGDLSCLMRVS